MEVFGSDDAGKLRTYTNPYAAAAGRRRRLSQVPRPRPTARTLPPGVWSAAQRSCFTMFNPQTPRTYQQVRVALRIQWKTPSPQTALSLPLLPPELCAVLPGYLPRTSRHLCHPGERAQGSEAPKRLRRYCHDSTRETLVQK